jgi:hypothetical protein
MLRYPRSRSAAFALALSILALVLTASASAQSIRYGTRTGVFDDPLSVVFINTATPYVPYAPGQWHTISLASLGVPADAISADISIIAGVTHNLGFNAQCWVAAQFRKPGSTFAATNWDIISSKFLDPEGDREATGRDFPIVNAQIEFYWDYNKSGGTDWCLGGNSGLFVNARIHSFVAP